MRRKYDEATFDKGNALCASIVLERPEAYGAGMCEWAHRWQAGHPTTARRWQHAPVVATVGTAQRGEQLRLGFDDQERAEDGQEGKRA
jgi:hypothetical protein